MSENEIVKHVESAYKAVRNPQTHWLHKLKEVAIEIAIIVFAVSLSIWFHNWSDSLHEHKEEREYLLGLRNDVQANLASARDDSVFYARTLYKLEYFQRVGSGQPLSPDSLLSYQSVFFSSVTLDPRVSRYEGLKGSGKLGIIENTDLLNNIINLHEVTIKHTEFLDNLYAEYSNRLGNFLQEHGTLGHDNLMILNAEELIRMSQMRLLIAYGVHAIPNNMLRYQDSCIVQCRQVIRQIDSELNLVDSNGH